MRTVTLAGVLLAACVVPTIAVSRWMAETPNVALREADFGTVVATQLRPSWMPDGDVTTVTTTAGVLALKGLISMPRGQPVIVVDSIQHGVRACVDGKLSGCIRFAGPYTGALSPMPHAPTWLNHATWDALQDVTAVWATMTGLACLFVVLFGLVQRIIHEASESACTPSGPTGVSHPGLNDKEAK